MSAFRTHLGPSPWLTVLLAGIVALAASPSAQNGQIGPTAASMLEAAIQKQLVTGDLVGAIAQYEAILTKHADQRRIASQALLQLAQAQEQLARIDDARRSYTRLMREYPDDPSMLRTVQARLNEMDERIDLDDLGGFSALLGLDESSRPTVGTATTNWAWWEDRNARMIVFSDVGVYDRQTGETRRLTNGTRTAAYPLVSPNGLQVAYLSWNGDLKEEISRRDSGYRDARISPELRITAMAGGNDRVVARFPGVEWIRPFAWSADNASVVTLLERTSGLRQIALVGIQTGTVRILRQLPWLSVQNMAISDDGRFVAYKVATPRNIPQHEFFILPVDDPRPEANERRYAISLASQRGARVTEDDLAIHVLNRMGFGPRKGDIERVKKMGIDAYIDQQLHPEKIADPVVDPIVSQFKSLKMEIPELIEATAPVAVIADRRRSSIFDRQDVMDRNNAAVKAATGGLPNVQGTSDPFLLDTTNRPLDIESNMARMIRAVHSEKQLQEVLVDFWMNHFSVNHKGDDRLIPSFEEQAIRSNVFGKFENMLVQVSRNPKMLFYLDNWRSSAPAAVIDQRLAEQKKAGVDAQLAIMQRQSFLKDSKGINENFARELLELHTMGVDSGYKQEDIVNVAKILTGWTIKTRGIVGAFEEEGVFMFDPLMHVEGDKVVLGQTFKSGGVDEGMALLKMLARRPETAKFIATKLARRFIADTPPVEVIDEAAKTFLRTDGDLRETVRTILMSPQFRSSEAIRSKVKKPFELVVSALRAVDATFEDNAAYARLIEGNNNNPTSIQRMGERMYDHEAPDGNPDVGPAWMNSNALLVRFEFANSLAMNRVRGIKANLTSAEALLTQLGVPKPTPQQIEQTRTMMIANEAKNALPAMGAQGGMMMAGGPAASTATQAITPAALTVAAMLGSPQFQKR